MLLCILQMFYVIVIFFFLCLTAKQWGSPTERVSDPIQGELHAVGDRGSNRTGSGSPLPCSPALHQETLPSGRPAGPWSCLPQGDVTSEPFGGQRAQPSTCLIAGWHWWHEGWMRQSIWGHKNQQQWVSELDVVIIQWHLLSVEILL